MPDSAQEECARLQCPGFVDSVFAGFTIGAPPIINYGSLQMKHEILPGVLAGIYCSLGGYQDFQNEVPELPLSLVLMHQPLVLMHLPFTSGH